MTTPTKIYLAGPMSGLPDHNYPHFTRAAKALSQLGFVVVNPANLHGDLDAKWKALSPDDRAGQLALYHEFLKRDLRELLLCTHVFLLDGWQESNGACLEGATAHKVGIEVVTFSTDTLTAIEPLMQVYAQPGNEEARDMLQQMLLRGVAVNRVEIVEIEELGEVKSGDFVDYGLTPGTRTAGPIQ